MQAVTQSPSSSETRPAGLAVSYELIAVVMLALLSLALRVAELDNVPLTNYEASQALAAWRVLHPHLPGSTIVPDSPLLFLLHSIVLSISGGAEAAVRSFTALAGVGLVLSPLLFRCAGARASFPVQCHSDVLARAAAGLALRFAGGLVRVERRANAMGAAALVAD